MSNLLTTKIDKGLSMRWILRSTESHGGTGAHLSKKTGPDARSATWWHRNLALGWQVRWHAMPHLDIGAHLSGEADPHTLEPTAGNLLSVVATTTSRSPWADASHSPPLDLATLFPPEQHLLPWPHLLPSAASLGRTPPPKRCCLQSAWPPFWPW
jgi:hypothetical protein